MATKWGIVSAGKISNDFCAALKVLSQDDHQIVAVAARNLERAKEFAEIFGISKSYGCYEDLAKDPDIEIVYVGSINTEHHSNCMMMLNHGKHVLCEKPFTMDEKLTREVIETAREKKLFIMEACWARFFPVYEKVRSELTSLGELKLVCAQFGLILTGAERVRKRSLGGNGVYDIGYYLIQLATMVFGERPEKVICEGTLLPTGVDEGACIILRYSGGRFAQLSYNINCKYSNKAEIIGTEGSIQIDSPFWCPLGMKTPTGDHQFPLSEGIHKFNFDNSAGLQYEADYVRKCIRKGETECEVVPHEHTIIICEVMDEVARQLGSK